MNCEKASSDGKKLLKIHVIGAGKGESIILEMPNNNWGVVDCYSPSLSDSEANPTIIFLRRNNVEELEFLCLTHPHDDHYLGMTQLIKEFRVNRFWRFPPRPLQKVVKYFKAVDKEKGICYSDSAEELKEIFRLFDEIRREKDRIAKEFVELTEGFKLLLNATISIGEEKVPLRIFSLGPSGNLVDTYQEVLEKYFSGKIMYASKIDPIHNLISSVLLVVYGNTHVILGGDAPKKNWKYILNNFAENLYGDISIASHLVKISHHGSLTGLVNNLWKTLTNNKAYSSYAVLTPFTRYGLPERLVVEHISSYTMEVFSTNLDCLNFRYRKPEEVLGEYNIRKQLRDSGSKARVISDPSSQIIHRCSFSFNSDGECDFELEGNGGPFSLEL